MTNFYSWVFDGGLKPDMPNYLDMFDRQDFDAYGGNYGDCRNHIHLLSPDMYLALCEPIPADDMTRHVDLEKKFKSGEIKKFDHIPELRIRKMEDGEDAKVFGHDGRHRVLLMKKLGYRSVPVHFIYENGSWGVTDPKKYPKWIWCQNDKSQKRDKYKFAFPVPFKDRETPFVLPDDARKTVRQKELKEGK